MKLLVFVLNKEEFLEEVLEAYVEAGVAGATYGRAALLRPRSPPGREMGVGLRGRCVPAGRGESLTGRPGPG